MTLSQSATFFDAYYFAHDCGQPYQINEEWVRFFNSIADRIVMDIAPRTVLDAGCAMGFLVEALRQRGVEAFGLDVSEYAIQNVLPTVRAFCQRSSVSDPLTQKYDLIVCMEVLEHLAARDVEHAIANLCAHTDDILFSSTPLDYKEATHFNTQPPEYWAEWFARNGFFRDVDFDASFVTPWAVRFRHRTDPVPRLAREYERKFWLLWKENTDLRQRVLELRQENAAILDSQTWHLAKRLQKVRARIAPPGSRRAHWLERRWRGIANRK